MITYRTGDVTQPHDDGNTAIIAHVCNDVNAFGAGVALAIARRWPLVKQKYHAYLQMCRDQQMSPLGSYDWVIVDGNTEHVTAPRLNVANLFAQRGLRSKINPRPLDYGALTDSLGALESDLCDADADFRCTYSVHMPRIGCGLAGGAWVQVVRIVDRMFAGRQVFVYDLP